MSRADPGNLKAVAFALRILVSTGNNQRKVERLTISEVLRDLEGVDQLGLIGKSRTYLLCYRLREEGNWYSLLQQGLGESVQKG